MLYARRSVAERLDLPKLEPAPGAPPDSLETGTQNHEGIVGAGAAVEFLASLEDAACGPRWSSASRPCTPTPRLS